MSMLNDEIAVLKSLMIKLNDDVAMIVSLQYHSERNEYSKVDHGKSRYRWLARVFKIDDMVKTIKVLKEDSNRLNKFKWPKDPWPYYTCAGYPENWKIAEWFAIKLKKMHSWEDGIKFLDGWQTKTKKRAGGYKESAKYETEGYLDEDGKLVSIKDKDALLKHIGQNLIKVKPNEKSRK